MLLYLAAINNYLVTHMLKNLGTCNGANRHSGTTDEGPGILDEWHHGLGYTD